MATKLGTNMWILVIAIGGLLIYVTRYLIMKRVNPTATMSSKEQTDPLLGLPVTINGDFS